MILFLALMVGGFFYVSGAVLAFFFGVFMMEALGRPFGVNGQSLLRLVVIPLTWPIALLIWAVDLAIRGD